MPFPMAALRPKSLAAWLGLALFALTACQQANVSKPSGRTQARAPAPALTMEPAIPAPSRPYHAEREDRTGAAGKGTRVGLLLPLSGPEAPLGRSLMRAAQMAIFDVAKDRFVLLPQDTGGTAGGAAEAARAAIGEGAQILLGPVFSRSVAAAAPIARDAGINVVAFSNDKSVAGDGAFLLGLLPSEQVERIVRYARSQGILRIAALVPDSEFGRQVEADLTKALKETDGVLAQVERYGDRPDDATAAVRRLARYDDRQAELTQRRDALVAEGTTVTARKMAELESKDAASDLGYDAILLVSSGSRLKEIAALLPFYDIDTSRVRVLGLASWQSKDLGHEPALVGAWFAAPSTEARHDFVQRYRAAYGEAPDPLAPLAYDAAALAAVLAQSGDRPDFSAAALTSASGFLGTAGVFRFLDSGEAERGLSVYEIGPNDFREISRAPESFQAYVN